MNTLTFQKVLFENFRVYQGEHEIVFSTDPGKKLTLIHAENSTGKTTSLVGMKWCLFGNISEFHRDDSELVNSHSGKTSCKVKLNFSLGKKEYQVVRSYSKTTHKNQLDGKLTLFEINNYGSHTPVDEAQAFINGVMPKELAGYFLFAGEQFAEDVVAKKENHRRAFRNILGFRLAEMAIEDLGKVAKDYEQEMRSIAKQNQESKNTAKLLETIDRDIDDQNKEIKRLKKDRDIYEKEFNNAQKIIDNSDHVIVGKLNTQLKEKEKDLVSANKRLKDELLKKNKLISEYGYCLFGLEFGQTSIEFIQQQEQEHGLPSDYGQKFVEQLLNSHTCCCGRGLEKGTKEYELVENLINTASTDTISNRVRKAQNVGEHFRYKSKKFLDELQSVEKKIKNTQFSISSLEDTIQQTKNELECVDRKGAEKIPEQIKKRNYAQQKQKEINYELGQIAQKLKALKDNKKLQEREMRSHPSNARFEKLEAANKYVKLLMMKIEQELRKTELNTIMNLKKSIQDNIDRSMEKKWKVHINSDYEMEIISKLGGHSIVGYQGGKGLLQLSSLALNAALIAHSKGRSNNKNTLLQPGIVAPLVIDAPFAQMGVGNQLNALGFLVEQSQQIILFLTTGQWRDEFEEIVKPYIGRRYLFVDHSSNCREKIVLKGNTYQLCEYNKNLPPTEVKEII